MFLLMARRAQWAREGGARSRGRRTHSRCELREPQGPGQGGASLLRGAESSESPESPESKAA